MMCVSVLCFLILIYLGQSADICSKKKFYPRPELENTFFAGHLVGVASDVSRTGCFKRCTEIAQCHMVLFRASESKCRLYSAPLGSGSSSSGWQYYGTECFKHVDLMNEDAISGNLTIISCSPNAFLLRMMSSSCLQAGVWKTSQGICVPFLGPSWFQIKMEEPIKAGDTIIMELQSGSGDNSRVSFRQQTNEYWSLTITLSWTDFIIKEYGAGPAPLAGSTIDTGVPLQSTALSLQVQFTDDQVRMHVNNTELVQYNLTALPQPMEFNYIAFVGFAQIFEVIQV